MSNRDYLVQFFFYSISLAKSKYIIVKIVLVLGKKIYQRLIL